jgi:hypothetical protein
MMNRRMVVGDIVTIVGFSQCPVMAKLTLAFPASEPIIYFMSIAFSFYITLLLTMLRAVVLLVCIGAGGCVWPKYSSV